MKMFRPLQILILALCSLILANCGGEQGHAVFEANPDFKFNLSHANDTLSWNSIRAVPIYTIKRAEVNGSYAQIAEITTTNYKLPSFTVKAYKYQINTCNIFNVCFDSNVVSVVSTPSITNLSNNSGTLHWSAVSGATSYKIERAEVGGSYSQISATITTSYLLPKVTTKVYQYRVKACSSSNLCNTSNVVSVASTPLSNNSGTLLWSPVAGMTNYTIERAEVGGSYSSISATTATSYQLPTVTAKTYKYRIKACNSSNLCDTSNVISVGVELGELRGAQPP